MKLQELSTSDINDLLADIKYYKGCYPNDYVNNKIPSTHEYLVLNLQNMNQGGSHWVALINKPNSEYIEYYDSFGLPPTEEVLKYMRRSGKRVVYNSNQIQAIDSYACGYFASYIIKQRSHGVSPYDIIYTFDINDLPKNEKILIKYFR